MTLTLRKFLVLAIIAGVFLVANALVIVHWLNETGAIDTAALIRKEFLTGTAITVILALLILLVGPGYQSFSARRSCPVCDRQHRNGTYCSHCGSKV